MFTNREIISIYPISPQTDICIRVKVAVESDQKAVHARHVRDRENVVAHEAVIVEDAIEMFLNACSCVERTMEMKYKFGICLN